MAKQPDASAPDSDWLVWADALQQERDPRGELIVLGASGKTAERDAYVREHAEALFGTRIAQDFDHYRFRWRHCLLEHAEVRIEKADQGAPLVQALLGSRAAGAILSLGIAGVTAPDRGAALDLSPAIDALRGSGLPPACRRLSLVDDRARDRRWLVSRDYDPGPNLVDFGPLERLWPALSTLEELTLVVADASQLQMGAIALPVLRAFRLECLYWGNEDDDGLSDALAAAQWPRLASFETRLPEVFTVNRPDDADAYRTVYVDDEEGGYRDELDDPADGENYEGTPWDAVLEPLLGSLRALPLERLALTSFDSAARVLDALADGGLPPPLKELDLSDSALNDKNGEWMLEHASLFAPLKRLFLRRVAMSEATAKKLESMGPAIVHSHADSAPEYRYVVGME